VTWWFIFAFVKSDVVLRSQNIGSHGVKRHRKNCKSKIKIKEDRNKNQNMKCHQENATEILIDQYAVSMCQVQCRV
jgi:hypothetical protein